MSATPRDGGPAIDPEDPTGPGPQLREARHRANLSLEEVATQLRLDRRTVRALEENEFQHLPAPTFIRGYIRSYARLLGLPPGPILEAYDYQGFRSPAIMADITQRPQARSSDFPVRLATYVVAAGLVAMVVMWWHSRESAPQPPANAERVAGAPADSSASPAGGTDPRAPPEAHTPDPPAPPAEELIARKIAPDTHPESGAAPVPSAANAAPEVLALQNPAPGRPAPANTGSAGAPGDSAGDAAADPATNRTVPVREALVTARETPATRSLNDPQSVSEPTPAGRLVILYSDDSWVEIFDADGIRREFRLASAGSRTSVRGKPPFNVLLGYAAGASVTFDGEDHDISRYIRGDTARFLIGPDGLAKARPPEPRPAPSDAPADAESGSSRSPEGASASQLPAEADAPGAN